MTTTFLTPKNTAKTTLAEPLDNSETGVDVTDASVFPADGDCPFHITIDDEIMTVTGVASNTLTVTRGAESTTPATHDNGRPVELRITAEAISDLNTAVNALEACAFLFGYDAVVLANDAPAAIKAAATLAKTYAGNAIQICDGTNDEVQLQAAIDHLADGGSIGLIGHIFNIDALTEDATDDIYYGIAFPEAAVAETWMFRLGGHTPPAWANSGAIQNEGCIIKITATAIATLPDTGTDVAVGIWNIGDGTGDYNHIALHDFVLRFPAQRNHDHGIDLRHTSIIETDNVTIEADDVAYTSLSPATGLTDNIGFRSNPTATQNTSLRMTRSVGWYLGFQQDTEHAFYDGCIAWKCVYPIKFGVVGSGIMYHPNTIKDFQEFSCVNGLIIDSQATQSSLFNIISYCLEYATEGVWTRGDAAVETNPGRSRGFLTYTPYPLSSGVVANYDFWKTGGNGKCFETWNSFLNQHPSVKVYMIGDQTIPNTIVTTIDFENEDLGWDTDNMHDNTTNNSRLVAPVAGRYLITAMVDFEANGTGTRYIKIQEGGDTEIADLNLVALAGAGVDTRMALTVETVLAKDEYIELLVWQDSGGALAVIFGIIHTSFGMSHLGPPPGGY